MKSNTALKTQPFTDDGETGRETRGRQIAKLLPIKPVGAKFAVPSQTQPAKGYIVDVLGEAGETCTCPDYELHHKSCKHVHAVYTWIALGRDVGADGTVTETLTVKRKTYPQHWPSYNESAVNEKDYVLRFLKALCDGIVQPPRKPGVGRNKMPIRDATFAAVFKVYMNTAQRWMGCDLDACAAKGLVDKVGHFNTISNFLGAESSTEILTSLIEESAVPLGMIENGQYAIDSTGFSTITYDRYFDHKHGKMRAQHPWVTLHVAVGTVTHVVTGVIVKSAGDSPQLPDLLKQTMKHFDVRELSADKAYGSHENRDIIEACGVQAYIPFLKTAVMDKKNETWSRHLCEFLFNQEKFFPHYHRRSNVESTFSEIKRVFGGAVRSKTPRAQVNEVLCKVLCHNLRQLVKAVFKSGLAPKFWQDVPATAPALTLVLS